MTKAIFIFNSEILNAEILSLIHDLLWNRFSVFVISNKDDSNNLKNKLNHFFDNQVSPFYLGCDQGNNIRELL